MALETRGHGRRTNHWGFGIYDRTVTNDTLAMDFLLNQVLVMGKQDPIRTFRFGACELHGSIHELDSVGVAGAAIARPWRRVDVRLSHFSVTSRAGQTIVFTRTPALGGQVRHVRKNRRTTGLARAEDRNNGTGRQYQSKRDSARHGSPPSELPNV